LGIVFDIRCTDTAHYWKEKEKIHGGVMFQCIKCLNYIWLPASAQGAEILGNMIAKFGKDEGYCRYLNHASRRPAKILIAKMQELRRLSNTIPDHVELAKKITQIIDMKDYDKVGGV